MSHRTRNGIAKQSNTSTNIVADSANGVEMLERISELTNIVSQLHKIIQEQDAKINVLVEKIDQLNFKCNISEQERRDMHAKITEMHSVTQLKKSKTSSEKPGTPVSSKVKAGNNSIEPRETAERSLTGPCSAIARIAFDDVAGAVGLVADSRAPKERKNKMTQRVSRTIIRGENTSTDNILTAADKRAWIYVGRTNLSTTAANLKKYLTDKLNSQDVSVDELEANNVTVKTSRSFKVGVKYDYLECLEKPEFWPAGIIVRKFRFFRSNASRSNTKSFTIGSRASAECLPSQHSGSGES